MNDQYSDEYVKQLEKQIDEMKRRLGLAKRVGMIAGAVFVITTTSLSTWAFYESELQQAAIQNLANAKAEIAELKAENEDSTLSR